ncbi:MAG: hypothetical protein AAF519_18645, partial [Bacteroidota bacterium]
MKTELIQNIIDPSVVVNSEWIIEDVNEAFKDWRQIKIVGKRFEYLAEQFSDWCSKEDLIDAFTKGESRSFS